MLTVYEKVGFLLLAAVCLALAGRGFLRVARAIARGQDLPPPRRLLGVFLRRAVPVTLWILLQRPILRTRPVVGVLHAFIFFAFTFYTLVNILDLLEGYVGLSTVGRGGVVALYNFMADLLSVGALVGMTALLVRRFGLRPFRFNEGVLVGPGVRRGIPRDSLIVGGFILLHVGFRFLGQAVRIAEEGRLDPAQPFASALSLAVGLLPQEALPPLVHLTWWMALGLILLFLPYFAYSKHIHLLMAPLNWILRDPGRPFGALGGGEGPVGARRLEDLRWYQLLDAYACIMCNRCQDVCPAHSAGQVLSPAALEINKRYWLNRHLGAFARGEAGPLLVQEIIPPEAVWACTTCGACVAVCPVGNRPLLDILMVRQALVEEGDLDPGLQKALLSLQQQGNSFGKSNRLRGAWTRGLSFPVKDARREPVEWLWFVGDFASFDPRCQEVSRTVATLFHRAGLDFGILYEGERNSGNDARRVGEEGLFEHLARQNLAVLAGARFERIVTTDPHTYNALLNDYPALGFRVPVFHYTQVLLDLVEKGRLPLRRRLPYRATYHDPCYLARHNGVVEAPRRLLALAGVDLVEMPRHGANTFCCGAGGGRVWMMDRPARPPAEQRIEEALAVLSRQPGPADTPYLFIVACPKDLAMYTDAVKTTGNEGRLVVRDIAQVVAEAVGEREPLPVS